MYIEQTFKEFIDNLTAEKNASEATVEAYTFDGSNLINFIRKHQYSESIESITTPILRQWISYLKHDMNYHPNTIRR